MPDLQRDWYPFAQLEYNEQLSQTFTMALARSTQLYGNPEALNHPGLATAWLGDAISPFQLARGKPTPRRGAAGNGRLY